MPLQKTILASLQGTGLTHVGALLFLLPIFKGTQCQVASLLCIQVNVSILNCLPYGEVRLAPLQLPNEIGLLFSSREASSEVVITCRFRSAYVLLQQPHPPRQCCSPVCCSCTHPRIGGNVSLPGLYTNWPIVPTTISDNTLAAMG